MRTAPGRGRFPRNKGRLLDAVTHGPSGSHQPVPQDLTVPEPMSWWHTVPILLCTFTTGSSIKVCLPATFQISLFPDLGNITGAARKSAGEQAHPLPESPRARGRPCPAGCGEPGHCNCSPTASRNKTEKMLHNSEK